MELWLIISEKMNIDYLEASLFVDKDKINLDELDHISTNKWGWDNYSMTFNNNKYSMAYKKDEKEISIRYNSKTKQLKVLGSLPYFVEGQNFSNDINKLKEGIQLISDTIDTNLFEAEVNLFEAGITIEIPNKPIEIFNSHYKIPQMETKPFKRGKLYEDAIRQIKLYNSGYRLRRVLSIADRLRLTIEKGYNPEGNYLRLESKYKKPTIHFKQRIIFVEDIFKSNFINNCKIDLFNTYKMIKKEGIFTPPQTKKDCTLPAIELLVLKELAMIYGFNAEECIKNKITSIPDSIINKEVKKNRKRSLAGLSKKIKENAVSYYDLSKVLKDRLEIAECFI